MLHYLKSFQKYLVIMQKVTFKGLAEKCSLGHIKNEAICILKNILQSEILTSNN